VSPVDRITNHPNWFKAVRYVPILGWLPRYERDWLKADLIAGFTLWGVGVPSALAYAQMAGMPPVTGLYTAFVALFLYSVLGTSRHLKVTTSSTMAVMSASLVGGLALANSEEFLAASSLLALIVGGMLLFAGIAKLGVIADFLSKPVVTGFVFGLAINIIISQCSKILGYPAPGGNSVQQLWYLVTHLEQTHWLTLLLGVGSLVLILWLRNAYPKIPGSLVALAAGILLVRIFQLDDYGVTVVGSVPTGLPALQVPFVADLNIFLSLFIGAVGIVFLAVGESVGTARAFATRYRYPIDADQELIAMGVANLGSGVLQGFTADASLSTTATADAAGAKSQLSSLIAAGMILLTAALLAWMFRNLPNAVLGAIVIASVLKLIDVKEMVRYRRERRVDFWLAALAAVGVLVTSVLAGLLAAVFLSLAIIIYQTRRPRLVALGRTPDDNTFADIQQFPNVRPVPGVLLLRLNSPLYFYNANQVSADVTAAVDAVGADLDAIVIDIRSTARLDISSSDMLAELADELRRQDVALYLVVIEHVRQRLLGSSAAQQIDAEHVTLGLHQAVQQISARPAVPALADQVFGTIVVVQ
jgi:sulfate permease, SulP family